MKCFTLSKNEHSDDLSRPYWLGMLASEVPVSILGKINLQLFLV